jgi:hypothetical protein
MLPCEMWYERGRVEGLGFYMRPENSSLGGVRQNWELLQWQDVKYFGERNYNEDIFNPWKTSL